MQQIVSISRAAEVRARNVELGTELRAAVMSGDEVDIRRLLSELLRVQGLTKGQRVSLQLKALLNLVHCMRAAALNDDATGLYNRRGFTQIGTRLLDVAAHDGQAAHLLYIDAQHLSGGSDPAGRAAWLVALRQIGNLLRDLFPSYGVYEALGRLSRDEFAVLTLSSEHATRGAAVLRARSQQLPSLPGLPLHIGIARFAPARPLAIEELLESARAEARAQRPAARKPAEAADGTLLRLRQQAVAAAATPGASAPPCRL